MNIGKSTFYCERGVLWPTIEALDELFKIGIDLDNDEFLQSLAEGFNIQSNGIFKDCIMAIDGLAVRTRQPYRSEVNATKDYRNRKGGFAIVVMAGCDSVGKFIMATANHSGSTNDIIAWQSSELFKAIELGRLDSRYFIIGDEAFTNDQQFLSPWPGRGIGKYKDSFNYWLSHSRQVIERAFGMLTKRWGIFWRKFLFSFERWALVVQVCMKLHNYCIEKNEPPPLLRFNEDHVRGDEDSIHDNNCPEEDQILRQPSRGLMRNKRNIITEYLETQGIVRPPHAEPNSRAL